MNPYEKLLNRKRTWTPVQTTGGKLKEGAEETIYRALAIRHMELPVGDFISDALEKDVPASARVLLESNVKDEIKHDLAHAARPGPGSGWRFSEGHRRRRGKVLTRQLPSRRETRLQVWVSRAHKLPLSHHGRDQEHQAPPPRLHHARVQAALQ